MNIKNSRQNFSLECHTDKNSPVINKGDIIFIHRTPEVDDGALVFATVDDDPVVARITFSDNYIVLQFCNTDYQPMFFIGDDLLRVKIIGFVFSTFREF